MQALQGVVSIGTVCLMIAMGGATPTDAATILYADRVVSIGETLPDPTDLWVTPQDLTRINGFVLKPDGASLGAIRIAVDQNQDSAMLVSREGRKWFNVTELARKLEQAYAFDNATNTWSFGEILTTRTAYLESAQAPDFALKDRMGKTVRLSDFRGKKVLLMTWASW